MTVGLGGGKVASMRAHSAGRHWFFLHDGVRRGPFTYADLTRAAQEGLVTAETNIWRPGWQKWHPARRVKGLLGGLREAPRPAAGTAQHLSHPQSHGSRPQAPQPGGPQSRPDRAREAAPPARPVNEAPLAPDGNELTGELNIYAPPPREARGTREVVAPRSGEPAQEKTAHIFADEWRRLAEQPVSRPGRGTQGAGKDKAGKDRAGKDRTGKDRAGGDRRRDGARAAPRGKARRRSGGAVRRRSGASFLLRGALGLGALLLLAGGAVLESGVLASSGAPGAGRWSLFGRALVSAPAAGDLPLAVAGLPAVAALQRNDRAAFDRFKRRYALNASDVGADEVLSVARAALRKSVKHLLAVASGDVLLEITGTYLAYMQGLQKANPESCVALSDESKGARLTNNLAVEFPGVFNREMTVLERIARTNPRGAVAPITKEAAQPYFDKVIERLRQQSAQVDLQGRERLDPGEFPAYCALVIAFYQAVLDLPGEEKVNVLRYLYADAAVNADSDLAAR